MNQSKTIKINARQSIQLHIVKAVEECQSSILSVGTISRANVAANGEASDIGFLKKRTAYLFLQLPESVRAWTHFALLPEDWFKIFFLIPFLFGLASNYLGGFSSIHILYNPLVFLLVWNFLIYLILIISLLFKRRPKLKENELSDYKNKHKNSSDTLESMNNPNKSIMINLFLGGIFKKITMRKARLDLDMNNVKNVIGKFWDSYKNASSSSLHFRLYTLLHIGSIGLVIGALLGIFIRGLFFEYYFSWHSTFLHDINHLTTLLNILLGPACLILDGKLLTINNVQLLLSDSGAPAAQWIYRLSLTTAMFVIIPRSILSLLYYFLSYRRKEEIDLNQEYFLNLFEVRKNIVDEIRKGTSDIIEGNIEILADRTADFIVKEYFDGKISPIILAYKNEGGKLSSLKNNIEKANISFQPVLEKKIEKIFGEFNNDVQSKLFSFLGKRLSIKLVPTDPIKNNSYNQNSSVTDKVASNIGDSISIAITTAIVSTIATISGGLGNTLGVAIVSALLGVSGPVGMIIGGSAALLVAGGAYKYNRESITKLVQDWDLPSFMLFSLNDKTIKNSRNEIYNKTHDEIKRKLEPMISTITEEIIENISPRIGNA